MARAFLFDMDGTLSDTDHYHYAAVRQTLMEEGIELDEAGFVEHAAGRSNREMAAHFFPDNTVEQNQAFARRKEATFRAIALTLVPITGAVALLDWARANDVRVALVTNAPRLNANHVLELLRLQERFEVVVLGDELARGKPDPLPYTTALELLGIPAADGIAFEDSVPGITAAKAAGLYTIGICSTQSEALLLAAGADLAVRDYEDARLLRQVEHGLG